MAAISRDTKVGFQQFPESTSAIPDEKEMFERVCLSLNLKDGQKSAAQSSLDPYTQALRYVEEHRIVEVFQVTIVTHIKRHYPHKVCVYISTIWGVVDQLHVPLITIILNINKSNSFNRILRQESPLKNPTIHFSSC